MDANGGLHRALHQDRFRAKRQGDEWDVADVWAVLAEHGVLTAADLSSVDCAIIRDEIIELPD